MKELKKQVLKDLLMCCSPSGEENDALTIWNKEIK